MMKKHHHAFYFLRDVYSEIFMLVNQTNRKWINFFKKQLNEQREICIFPDCY